MCKYRVTPVPLWPSCLFCVCLFGTLLFFLSDLMVWYVNAQDINSSNSLISRLCPYQAWRRENRTFNRWWCQTQRSWTMASHYISKIRLATWLVIDTQRSGLTGWLVNVANSLLYGAQPQRLILGRRHEIWFTFSRLLCSVAHVEYSRGLRYVCFIVAAELPHIS